MLYRAAQLPRIRSSLAQKVWNAQRPHCLDIDVALAALSDEVAYYAVPSGLKEGMLRTGFRNSSRTSINAESELSTEEETPPGSAGNATEPSVNHTSIAV
uniref:Uncharacterized protein n=1 Tax=Zooxanthella nutricula TaxID=1333877 RepID=A0A7S2QHP4_9DINO